MPVPVRYRVMFFVCCLPVCRLTAQILNIDKTDTSAYSRKAVWKGNIALGLEVDKQKTTLFDASNFLDVLLQENRELVIASASDRFTYNGPQDFLNEGFFHLRWRHLYKNTIQPETYTQYQWDDKRGLVRRFVSGINARFDFWHRHQWEIAFGSGLMFENELWNYSGVDSLKIPANPVDQERNAIKSNTYIKWEGKVSSVSNVSIVVFYQAHFSSFFEPRIASSLKFSVDISHHFAFGINFQGLYDAKPVVPISSFYYSFSNSLLYKL
jgi:hypothetical protein